MENAPTIPDSGTEKVSSEKDKDKDKKKSRLGLYAVESKPSKKDPDEKSRDGKSERRSWLSLSQEEPKESKKPELKVIEGDKEKPKEGGPEVEEASEAEAPTEEIGEAEKPAIQPEVVAIVRELNANRAADPDTDAPVEHLLDRVAAGEDPVQVGNEIIAELGGEEPAETEEAQADEVEAESENVPESDEEIVFDRSAEAGPEPEEEEPEDPNAAAAGSGTSTGVTAAGAGGTTPPPVPPTGGGGGTTPPHGPGGTGPGGPMPPFGPHFGGPGGPGGPGGFNPNLAPPVLANTQNTPPTYEQYDDRANPATMALFGGIIGYLIGRRRGRINTEKRLLPIQKKLEKQVTDMQWQIQEQESRIRRVAARKVRHDGPAVVEAFASKPKPEKSARPIQEIIRTEKVVERQRAPEAAHLHGKPAPEHIGHVLMAAESTAVVASAERVAGKKEIQKSSEKLPESVTGRRVETLNRAELLSLSEKIIVDGSSLRQIYETRLVGERGLRRLVAEHLRGGDLKKALRREIVEREIDFERDPILRDLAPVDSGGVTGGGAVAGNAALKQMLERATKNMPDSGEEAAFYKARADYEATQYAQQQKQRHLVDISLVATVAVLLGLITVLLLAHG